MLVTSYAPSEAAIEAAIEHRIGSAGFFQRVAEQLARGIYVDLGTGLVPFGRRPDDKAVRGWPDAYLTNTDGALIAIEASTAANARTKHWDADLLKLRERLKPERRGGLIWVAWCDPSKATDVAEMREQAGQLGISTNDTHIIFRRELCARLREPIHAKFWVNDLDLKVTSGPFCSMGDVIRLLNMHRWTSIFPTAKEYEEDRVYIAPILAEVERALTERHAALVVGHGAAGKTTLAMILSHRPRFRYSPTYYLDLTATRADPTLIERASEAISGVADRGVLFVIDNAHLDPEAAARLCGHWQTFGRGSGLLILTRLIRSIDNVWTDEPDLETLDLPSFDLIIQPSDLEGVYRRHHRSRRGKDAPPVEPAVLRRWHRLFGGDLMSFSAAVCGLLDRGREAAALESTDAVAYIRKRYLNDSQLVAERASLLDLAAVAEIEGLVPIEAFSEHAFQKCIRLGLILIEKLGNKDTPYYLYRLTHPGLGTLLRAAADLSATSRDDRCRVLGPHPFACVVIALRLQKLGDGTEARALSVAIWRLTEWPLASIPLHWWVAVLRMTRELEVLGGDEISTRLQAWLCRPGARRTLRERALSAPLGNLAPFLDYAAIHMPDVAEAVTDALTDENNHGLLRRQALLTPFGNIPSFLSYAKAKMPDVAEAVIDVLAHEHNRALLLSQALRTPLYHLAPFLDYSAIHMRDVAEAVIEGLTDENNRALLLRQALVMPFGHVRSFLDYAKAKMPDVAEAVIEALVNEDNRALLLSRALRTPLSNLVPFLDYAAVYMPDVAEAVIEALVKESNRALFLRQALVMPLGDVPSFLDYAKAKMPDVAEAVIEALVNDNNRALLLSRALTTPLGHLASFLDHAMINLPDLAETVIDALADENNRALLLRQVVASPLDHLGSFLDFAQKHISHLHEALAKAVCSKELLPTMTTRFIDEGPEKVTALCRQREAFNQILRAIDATAWSQKWLKVDPGLPSWFIGFASCCYKAGRAELVGTIAEAIIGSGKHGDLRSPNITMRHLTYVLTAPHGCTSEEIERFVARRVPSNWLADRYSNRHVTVGSLAGAVRSVALDDREWMRKHFRDPALWRRIAAEQPTPERSPRQLVEWLGLFGAARLLDRIVPGPLAMLPCPLSAILRLVTPEPGVHGIKPAQAAVWAGLREWCHLTRECLVIDPVVAERTLAEFRATADPMCRSRVAALNIVIIEWLNRARRQDWRLVVERTPLLDAVERQLGVERTGPSGGAI
jgi:hypothetical protein